METYRYVVRLLVVPELNAGTIARKIRDKACPFVTEVNASGQTISILLEGDPSKAAEISTWGLKLMNTEGVLEGSGKEIEN